MTQANMQSLLQQQFRTTSATTSLGGWHEVFMHEDGVVHLIAPPYWTTFKMGPWGSPLCNTSICSFIEFGGLICSHHRLRFLFPIVLPFLFCLILHSRWCRTNQPAQCSTTTASLARVYHLIDVGHSVVASIELNESSNPSDLMVGLSILLLTFRYHFCFNAVQLCCMWLFGLNVCVSLY